MFITGICIHVFFLFSIFDIYFKSPIVKNVVPYQPQHDALAERLVLFVVDGLRAESFINYTTMAYLRSIANSKGRWGISNTRVPTESRPGHVAVIAGFYEDPSAIMKGWKDNPVDFDSVLNRTSYTWCWGTYDIIEIFTKGSVGDHIFAQKFDPYEDTFSSDQNTTKLDDWVIRNVKEFFLNAKNDKDIHQKLKSSKISFFLHLLGTDTSGHTHKPKTPNFLTTIKFVDQGIKEIEGIIRDFYDNDEKTTFLMTSDHGMTDWGSHGAGDNHETQTPYVVWGAGVKEEKFEHSDPESKGMSLDHRLDITQADLAPLMSTILAIPVPVNSIGQLPSELLNISLANKAKALYSNSRQLASQYNRKRSDVESYVFSLFYYPYEPLSGKKYQEFIAVTEKLLADEEYEKLIIFSREIIRLSMEGLTYYHNYYQIPLLLLVTLAFIGWILYLLTVLFEQTLDNEVVASSFKINNRLVDKHRSYFIVGSKILSIIISLLSVFFVYAQNLPLQYNLYLLTPAYLWLCVVSSKIWPHIFRRLNINSRMTTVGLEIVCYTMGSLAMGLSFTYRWMLSFPLLGMGLWPLFSPSTRNHLAKPVLLAWFIGCLLLSTFSFIPVVGKEVSIELVVLAGLIWLAIMAVFTWKVLVPLYERNKETKREVVLTLLQMIVLVISLENIYRQSKRFEKGTPVSYLYQTLTWIIAVGSLISPLLHSKRLICRLFAINTSLLNFYLLLSVAHEGLFMVILIFNVTCWIYIEFRLHLGYIKINGFLFGNENFENVTKMIINVERNLSHQDYRRAFFFILYIILAFFGTGNIASLNSFEIRWVTCFITSFKPFIITGLILFKTLAPFLIVACGFRAVQHLTKAPSGYLNVIVLIYSNIMGIQLLYHVKNTGSWLEIGTSISQFVIVQVITLFSVVINQIAKMFTDVNVYSLAKAVFKSRKKVV